MSDKPITQSISARSDQRKNILVVTVESFYRAHAEKLHLKLEGKRVGFHRKIREPTINRPGLALAGFYNYFAEKRVQVLGAAEQSYLKSLSRRQRIQRFRRLCTEKIPCLVASRGAHLDPDLIGLAEELQIAVFRTPIVPLRLLDARTSAVEGDFS